MGRSVLSSILLLFTAVPRQGRRQVKKCGVDMHGERAEHEPKTRVWRRSPSIVQGAQPPTHSSRVKTHRICINLRNDLWQKWGGVNPVATPLCRAGYTLGSVFYLTCAADGYREAWGCAYRWDCDVLLSVWRRWSRVVVSAAVDARSDDVRSCDVIDRL